MITRGYLVHALSPMHPGVGQGIGLIDLPIAREATTQHPVVPGSSVKGVLRAGAVRRHPDEEGATSTVWKLFGPDQDHAEAFASALRVSDARILLFPVRSDRGTFAWITSPMVLHRYLRDVGPGAAGFDAASIPTDLAEGSCSIPVDSVIRTRAGVVLDGLPFEIQGTVSTVGEGLAGALFAHEPYWRDALLTRLCVIHDDLFSWLVEQATDVRAHIRVGPDGTVEQGALWHEETLPPETVLAGVVQHAPNGTGMTAAMAWDVLAALTREPIQLGGGATTGHGRARLHLLEAP